MIADIVFMVRTMPRMLPMVAVRRVRCSSVCVIGLP